MGRLSGLECRDDEKPMHEVTIPAPFALSVHEVTLENFDRFRQHNKVDDECWRRGIAR
ncbi:MAG: SUMF1/EgtB/PvdO family nonheme iron enzyme [Gammaproteobacteria bacterium]|nr:SUMF1/EgtB/PvdO family nonheme iron enzyme [Gammaproteobacteria bacterium]